MVYQDTAKSVEYIKQCNQPQKAALASNQAAKYYEMESLLENVQDSDTNMTRFLVIVNQPQTVQNANKISMRWVLKHEPGSLFKVLQCLNKKNINLLKLESRPIVDRAFEYCFYADFVGDVNNPEIQEVLEEIHQHCIQDLLIGCYKGA